MKGSAYRFEGRNISAQPFDNFLTRIFCLLVLCPEPYFVNLTNASNELASQLTIMVSRRSTFRRQTLVTPWQTWLPQMVATPWQTVATPWQTVATPWQTVATPCPDPCSTPGRSEGCACHTETETDRERERISGQLDAKPTWRFHKNPSQRNSSVLQGNPSRLRGNPSRLQKDSLPFAGQSLALTQQHPPPQPRCRVRHWNTTQRRRSSLIRDRHAVTARVSAAPAAEGRVGVWRGVREPGGLAGYLRTRTAPPRPSSPATWRWWCTTWPDPSSSSRRPPPPPRTASPRSCPQPTSADRPRRHRVITWCNSRSAYINRSFYTAHEV